MNTDLIAEVIADLSELPYPPAKRSEERTEPCEPPLHIVPEPPVPGKTAWSIAPW